MRTTVELLLWWGLLPLSSALPISRVSPLEMAGGGCLGAGGRDGAVVVRRASGAAVGGTAHRAQALPAFPQPLLGDTARLALAVAVASARHRCGTFRSVRPAPASSCAAPACSTPRPGKSASPGAAPPSTNTPRPGTAGTP
ncbi:hypothetical protein [Streptomyces sp. CB01881]|uniref:hypothetical protein n=1 Tax=Streptomyces sp. CB01881 TaxID=2078691 RepID=UPI0011DF4273|nr:hypothetical protein [Streptomyces sp. CB01881]TYC76282.1 hypothetical protein EH183_01125 [Streptomyces sp. CB01881]